MGAVILRTGFLDMQVCVPKDFTDEQVKEFADSYNPCGTKNGWLILKQGSKYLGGADERVVCSRKDDHVHIVLEA